jgi:hypothetical protein
MVDENGRGVEVDKVRITCLTKVLQEGLNYAVRK